MPVGQYEKASFIVAWDTTVNGTFNHTCGVRVRTMTPLEVPSYARSGKVSGCDWTAGAIANNSIYSLGLVLPAGAWYSLFANIPPTQTCAIGFDTDLRLTPW